MRIYKFDFNDLKCTFDDNGFLSLKYDPKYIYAVKNPDLFPIDVNSADYNELLKVPGIGIQSARRIIAARKSGFKFKLLRDLKRAGVATKRAEPFLKLKYVQRRLVENDNLF